MIRLDSRARGDMELFYVWKETVHFGVFQIFALQIEVFQRVSDFVDSVERREAVCV